MIYFLLGLGFIGAFMFVWALAVASKDDDIPRPPRS